MEFNEIIENRFCCRSFQNKKIEPEKIQAILEATNSAPSAGNLQAYHIFAVLDKAKKSKLVQASRGQIFIAEAPLVLVFCANPEKSGAKYNERGKNLYSVQDATISAVFAWLKAVDFGLSACWVGAFNEEEVKKNLGIDKSLKPVVILPIGYCREEKGQYSREKIEKHLNFIE
jgi:nitroreductase